MKSIISRFCCRRCNCRPTSPINRCCVKVSLREPRDWVFKPHILLYQPKIKPKHFFLPECEEQGTCWGQTDPKPTLYNLQSLTDHSPGTCQSQDHSWVHLFMSVQFVFCFLLHKASSVGRRDGLGASPPSASMTYSSVWQQVEMNAHAFLWQSATELHFLPPIALLLVALDTGQNTWCSCCTSLDPCSPDLVTWPPSDPVKWPPAPRRQSSTVCHHIPHLAKANPAKFM